MNFDVAVILDFSIFLELEEATTQLRNTLKGMTLFVFRLLSDVSCVPPTNYCFSFILLAPVVRKPIKLTLDQRLNGD